MNRHSRHRLSTQPLRSEPRLIPDLEALEDRTLLALVSATVSNGVLSVLGDNAADNFRLRLRAGDSTRIEVLSGNQVANSFVRASLTGLVVNGSGGNDSLIIDDVNGSVTANLPTTLLGGAGNDTLQGGAGNERLEGGTDADVLLGGSGNDTFVLGTSLNTLTATGNGTLNTALSGVQTSLNSQVFGPALPLVGTGLGVQGSPGQIVTSVQSTLVNAVRGAGATGDIPEALFSALGPQGLNVLADTDTSGVVNVNDIRILTNSPSAGSVTFDMRLARTRQAFNPSVSADANLQAGAARVAFAVGTGQVPILPDKPDGLVDLQVGYDWRLHFGVTSTGTPFVGTPTAGDLTISVRAQAPRLMNASGTAGIYNAKISDDTANPSLLDGTYTVDLASSAVTSSVLSGTGATRLKLESDFGGGSFNLRVLSDFSLTTTYSNSTTVPPQTGTPGPLGNPFVSFTNSRLDLGSFFSSLVAPIFSKIQVVTKPLQPVIDFFSYRIPVLSDIMGEAVTVSSLVSQLGRGGSALVSFIQAAGVINRFDVNTSIPGLEPNSFFSLGDFAVNLTEQSVAKSLTFSSGGLEASKGLAEKESEKIKTKLGNTVQGKSSADLGASFGVAEGFKFPILDDPTQIIQGFLGKDIIFFTFGLPKVEAGFTLSAKFYPFLPIPLAIGVEGGVSVSADLKFGFDSFGLRQYLRQRSLGIDNPLLVGNGFFVSDTERADGTGEDVPEFSITGRIGLSVGLGINLGLVEFNASIGGGLTAGFAFNLNDIDPDGPGPLKADGRLHLNEIDARLRQGPLCIFDINIVLTVSADVSASLKINLGIFKLTIFSINYNLGSVDLLEVLGIDSTLLKCPDIPPPTLASVDSNGVLTLSTTENQDIFIISHKSGDSSSETVTVTSGENSQDFAGVKSIRGSLGGGDDNVAILEGVLVDATLDGGLGNDGLSYKGSRRATLIGGSGNDRLKSSGGATTLDGGAGDDQLEYLGGATATLLGGDGNDSLTSEEGTVTQMGGSGNDMLQAGTGNDCLTGGDGTDVLRGGSGNDTLLGEGGNDILAGESGNDSLRGGDGDDAITGDLGNDVAFGDLGQDRLLWRAGDGQDTLEGGSGGDTGLGGDGDFLHTTGTMQNDNVLLRQDPNSAATLLITFNVDETVRVTGMETVRVDTYEGSDAVVIDHLARSNQQKINLHLNKADDTPDGVPDSLVFLGTAEDANSLFIPGDLIPSMSGVPVTPVPGGPMTLRATPILDGQTDPTRSGIPVTQEEVRNYVWDILEPDNIKLRQSGKTITFTPRLQGIHTLKVSYTSANGDVVTNSNFFNVQIPTFAPAVEIPTPPSLAVATGDFNKDGRSDIVSVGTGAAGASQITLQLSLGGDPVQFRTVTTPLVVANAIISGNVSAVPDGGRAVVVGDFTGDGQLDLAVASTRFALVTVYPGNGDGTFGTPRTTPLDYNVDALAVGDFNRDGRTDLGAADYTGGFVAALINNGDGTFGPRIVSANPGPRSNVDLNGDAIPDDLALAVATPRSIAVGDFNKDGFDDLSVTAFDILNPVNGLVRLNGPENGRVIVFMNNSGSFLGDNGGLERGLLRTDYPLTTPPTRLAGSLLPSIPDPASGLFATRSVTQVNFANLQALAGKTFENQPMTSNFRSIFVGSILITKEGPVTFFTRSDDGSRLYIDGRLVVDNDGIHPDQEAMGVIRLTPGLHDLRLDYFQAVGGANLVLSYDPQDGDKQVIPPEVLYQPRVAYEPGLRRADFSFPSSFSLNGGPPIPSSDLANFPDFRTVNPTGMSKVAQIDFPMGYSIVPRSTTRAVFGNGGFQDTFFSATENFASVFSGKIRLEAGPVTFFLESDDGSRLFLNGELLFINGGIHTVREFSATTMVAAGLHDIRVEYFQARGPRALKLSYTPAGGVKQTVPAHVLMQPRNTLTPESIRTEYPSTTALNDFPNFATAQGVNQVATSQITQSPSSTRTNFGVVFHGRLQLAPGAVTFFLTSDDGSRLFLDGELIVDNGGIHPLQERSATVTVTAGLHEFRVEYFQAGGGAGLTVEYDPADGDRQRIPQSAVFHSENLPPNGLRQANYPFPGLSSPDFVNSTPTSTGTAPQLKFTDISEGALNDVASLFTGQIYVPRSGPVAFYADAGDSDRIDFFLNDQLVLRGLGKSRGSIVLSRGYHDLRLEYKRISFGGALTPIHRLELMWDDPVTGAKDQLIPPSAFFLPRAPASGSVLPVGANPRALATGDFNKDGNLDLVAVNQDSSSPGGRRGTVTLRAGNGNGTFQAAQNFATPAQINSAFEGPRSLDVADLNGDGILDVVTANFNTFKGTTVSELRGALSGTTATFLEPITYSVGNSPTALAVGDFNADRNPDVVTVALPSPGPLTIAYVVNTFTIGNQNFGGAVGNDFSVTTPITITQLGTFDHLSNGLLMPITVRLFNLDTREVLATQVFSPGTGTLIGGSRFLPLTPPLSLPAGFRGTIVAENYGPDELVGNKGNANPPSSATNGDNGAVVFTGSSRFGTRGTFPETIDSGPADRYLAGTFQFQRQPPAVERTAYSVAAGVAGNQSFDGAVGNDFDVNSPITVTQLGAFDHLSDGLKVPITVRLFDRVSQQELASVVFAPNSGALVGGSRFQGLTTPLTLPAGFRGSIVAENYGPTELVGNRGNANSPTPSPTTDSGNGAIAFVGRSRFGAKGTFPANIDGGPVDRYVAGTFRFQPATTAPIAITGLALLTGEKTFVSAGGPYTVQEGDGLTLDAGRTTTPSPADRTTYSWDINGDGVFGDATGPSPTLTWAQLQNLGITDGPFTIPNVDLLVITADGHRVKAFQKTTLSVTNAPPTPSLRLASSTIKENDVATLLLSSTDPGRDTITRWEITWGDGKADVISGNPSQATHQYLQPGSYSITASVRDEDGSYNSVELLKEFPNLEGISPVTVAIEGSVNAQNSSGGNPFPAFGQVGITGLTQNYAVRWTGQISADSFGFTGGPVTFFLASDDGAQLFIDGELVVDNSGLHPFQERSATIPFSAGLHDIRLEYFQAGGGAGVVLSWALPGRIKEVIPPSAFSNSRPGGELLSTVTTREAVGQILVSPPPQSVVDTTKPTPPRPQQPVRFQFGTIDTVAYAVQQGVAGNQAFDGAVGNDFDVTTPITVTQLGAFDDLSDGLKVPITVRLFNRDTQQVLATQVFSPGSGTLVGGSRFLPLTTPVSLPAGFKGTIVAENYGATERVGNLGNANPPTPRPTTNSGNGALAFVGRSRFGARGSFPANIDGGPGDRYAAGTFLFSQTPRPDRLLIDGVAQTLPPILTQGVVVNLTPGFHEVRLQTQATFTPQTTFSSVLKAADPAGISLPFFTRSTGLVAEYYMPTRIIVANVAPTATLSAAVPLTSVPSDFSKLQLAQVRLNETINVPHPSTGFNGFKDLIRDFAVRWTGKLFVPVTGITVLGISSIGGSKVFINGNLELNNDGVRTIPALSTKRLNLTAGLHDIRIEGYEPANGNGFRLIFTPPGGTSQVLPSSLLTPGIRGLSSVITVDLGATSFTHTQSGRLFVTQDFLNTFVGTNTNARLTLNRSAFQSMRVTWDGRTLDGNNVQSVPITAGTHEFTITVTNPLGALDLDNPNGPPPVTMELFPAPTVADRSFAGSVFDFRQIGQRTFRGNRHVGQFDMYLSKGLVGEHFFLNETLIGGTSRVVFGNTVDPSSSSTQPSFFKYSYDFDNNGTFEITDSMDPIAQVPATVLATPGTKTIRGRIKDPNGAFTDVFTTLRVLSRDVPTTLRVLNGINTSPMIRNDVLTPEIVPGGTATLSGQLVEFNEGDSLSLEVNWGDGTPQEVFQPGLEPFAYGHTFAEPGTYNVRFTWLDDKGGQNSRVRSVLVESPEGRLVHALYRDLLQRIPDPDGLSYWSDKLQTGTSSEALVQGLMNSPERRGKQVEGYFRTYLGREADEAGRAYWVDRFLSGATEDEVVHGFVSSVEYGLVRDKASAGAAADGDVAAAPLRDLRLSEDVNPGDAVTLSGQLATPGSGFVLEISWGDGSPAEIQPLSEAPFTHNHTYAEPGFYSVRVSVVDDVNGPNSTVLGITVRNTLERTVDRLYSGLLGRLPGEEEAGFWRNQLNSGATPVAVAQAFVSSFERRRLQVEGLFRTYLKREVDEEGRNYWVQQLLNGVAVEDVVRGLVASAEYQAKHGR